MTEMIKSKIVSDFKNGTLTLEELEAELGQLEAAAIAQALGVPFLYTPYEMEYDPLGDDDPFVYDASRMTLEDHELRLSLLEQED